MTYEECIEKLAAYAHEAWSGWMKYQERKGGGAFWDALPAELGNRWSRQAKTDYQDLPEEEKKSDRVEARRMLAIVERYLESRIAEQEQEIARLQHHRKWALRRARKWLAGCRMLDYSDNPRAPSWYQERVAFLREMCKRQVRIRFSAETRCRELEATIQYVLDCDMAEQEFDASRLQDVLYSQAKPLREVAP